MRSELVAVAFVLAVALFLSGCTSPTKKISSEEEKIYGIIGNMTETGASGGAAGKSESEFDKAFKETVNNARNEIPSIPEVGEKETLSSCAKIDKPGYYKLNNDINISWDSSGAREYILNVLQPLGGCFYINSSDVVLDCQGHSVFLLCGDYVFELRNDVDTIKIGNEKNKNKLENIVIKNCRLDSRCASSDIRASNVDFLAIYDNDLNSYYRGIVLENVNSTYIFFNNITTSKISIRAERSNISISANKIYTRYEAQSILISDSDRVNINGNSIWSGWSEIELENIKNAIISKNYLTGEAAPHISLSSSNATVEHNLMKNGQQAVRVSNSNLTISGNWICVLLHVPPPGWISVIKTIFDYRNSSINAKGNYCLNSSKFGDDFSCIKLDECPD